MHSVINSKYLSFKEFPVYVSKIVEQEYNTPPEHTKKVLYAYREKMRRDIIVFFEYPYVDKFYRDSYYSYFSTKHIDYKRNSIRLSFFQDQIRDKNFRKKEQSKELNESFYGFITIRPTIRWLIGRNLISPLLLKERNFVCCLTKFTTSINGVKFDIHAFPHCSQDTETISCAETTLLNTMECFGNKYAEYAPVLPSRIIELLSQRASERQIPSSGLSVEDISFVLKDLGFSPKCYSSAVIKNDELFKNILDIYVESGIPVIAALENDKTAHAVVIIGRELLLRTVKSKNC